jgi:hypothetical protein
MPGSVSPEKYNQRQETMRVTEKHQLSLSPHQWAQAVSTQTELGEYTVSPNHYNKVARHMAEVLDHNPHLLQPKTLHDPANKPENRHQKIRYVIMHNHPACLVIVKCR